jgi:hypothetical protein
MSADMWLTENLRVLRVGQQMPPSQFMRISYEDLVTSPEKCIRRVVDYLGEEWTSSLLEHHKQPRGASSATYAVDHVDGGTRNDPSRSIDTGSLLSWRESLSRRDIHQIERMTREGMRLFGYEPAGSL